MIGIPHAFATLKRLTRPAWAKTDEDFLEVLVSPSLVQWDYVPYEAVRWRIFRCAQTGEIYEAFETTVAGEMFEHFTRTCLPQQEQTCIVLDDSGKVVLGWTHTAELGTKWTGCQFAFNVLAAVVDPMDVFVWESNARDNYDLAHSLQEMHRDHQ